MERSYGKNWMKHNIMLCMCMLKNRKFSVQKKEENFYNTITLKIHFLSLRDFLLRKKNNIYIHFVRVKRICI